jgi:hypothetical protein
LPVPRPGGPVEADRPREHPGQLDADDLAVARAFGFETVVDLRSHDEVLAHPYPLAQLRGYRPLPLIDPAAEAREDVVQRPGHRTSGSGADLVQRRTRSHRHDHRLAAGHDRRPAGLIEVDHSMLRTTLLAPGRTRSNSTAGYLRWLGLDDVAVDGVRQRLRP